MEPQPPANAFLRWDGLHLVFDLPMLEDVLRQRLVRSEHVLDLQLEGHGDVVRVVAKVLWKRLVARVSLELFEFRVRHRHLGFRMRRLRVLGGVPIPRGAVESILEGVDADILTVVRGQGIVILDLRRWLPSELELCLLTVQATEACLHLWIGPGGLHRLPGRRAPALESGAVAGDERTASGDGSG